MLLCPPKPVNNLALILRSLAFAAWFSVNVVSFSVGSSVDLTLLAPCDIIIGVPTDFKGGHSSCAVTKGAIWDYGCPPVLGTSLSAFSFSEDVEASVSLRRGTCWTK